MGPFKNVTCIMAFFIPFTFVTLCQFYSITPHVLRFFAYMTVSAYDVISKEEENHIFRHNLIFRQTWMYKNPHWQSSWIIIFLCNYYIVTSDKLIGTFLDMFFLLLAVIEIKKEKLSYRRSYIEEFVWGTSLFWLGTLLSMSFFLLSSSTPSPLLSDVLADWPL